MPLFVCERCETIENTALGRFWLAKKKLCSECRSGTWHGKFPRVKYDPRVHGPMYGNRVLLCATIQGAATGTVPDTMGPER
jgi:hypothetical protein